jgi:alkanesulfonate monooxygenase SsuD/methylene tetrahydromethanopterin reductase-like flavin-dependent oxidoreductase (luciferase family)
LQLPLRQPAVVAKQAAALAHLSSGRFVLGVGAGSRRGEYEAARIDYATRARALDRGIDILRQAWRGAGWAEDPDPAYRQLPAPSRVPVWVGGSSEAALRRAARVGEGWMPLFVTPEDYASALGRLDKETERAGREPHDVTRAVVVFVSVGGNKAAERGLEWMSSLYGIPARAFTHHLVAGSPRSCARVLERYVEAGADHVIAFLTADDPLVPFGEFAHEFAGRTDARRAGSSGPEDVRGNG